MSPLFYAIKGKNIQVVEFLINKGVSIERNEMMNRTPFYWACCLGK